jgi:hypothetical protein
MISSNNTDEGTKAVQLKMTDTDTKDTILNKRLGDIDSWIMIPNWLDERGKGEITEFKR